jgi:outer membrane protein OmpA-like peptidoglycan-associated protein
MFKPVQTIGLCTIAALTLGACSSASGPTYSAYTLKPVNGLPTHQVTCFGLLESRHACEAEAQKICAGQPVNVLQLMAPLNSSADGEPNNRIMVFQCGVPAPPPAPAPRPVVTPPPPPPPPAPRAEALSATVLFPFAKSELTAQAQHVLSDLASRAQGRVYSAITVEGYTDSVGPEAINPPLSDARAQAAANYLGAHGVRAREVHVQGHSQTNPVASNRTAQGRQQNRRVEIRLEP